MGSDAGEDWAAVLTRLLAGDQVALAQVNRLVTSQLTQLRAYDFRDEWDDLRQEVLVAVVTNATAGRLRDAQAFAGYVRILTRNKFTPGRYALDVIGPDERTITVTSRIVRP